EGLDLRVHGEVDLVAALGRDVLGAVAVGLDLHAVDVDEDELATGPAPEHRLVLPLDARLPDDVAHPVPLLLHLRELALGDLADVPEGVRGAEVAGRIAPPLPDLEPDAAKLPALLADARERVE